jgi:opacity protein-like surface antigen
MKKFAITVAAAAASLLSTGAMAQVYVSGAAGMGHVSMDCSGIASCDNSDLAVKFTGGYTFGSGFSAELGYIAFGKASASDAGVSGDLKADAFTLGVAYQLPLNDSWGVNFRLGAASVKAKASATDGVTSASDSETNTAPYYGLGLNFALTKNTKFDLGADFSRAELGGEKANVRAVTFGLRHDF